MITVESQGGLGNQLFQVALSLELSKTFSESVQMDTWRHSVRGARKFEVPCHDLGIQVVESHPRFLTSRGLIGKVGRTIRNQIDTQLYVESGHDFDPSVFYEPHKLRFTGYFQSWKYSIDSIRLISQFFDEYCHNSKWVKVQNQYLDDEGPWFAVHVRMGDYLTSQGQSNHGSTPVDYYIRAFELISKEYPLARPVVFSDSPDLAHRLLEFSQSRFEIFRPEPSGTALENLLLMSNASAIVTANSSFSWWAARLGELKGRSIYAPSTWYPPPVGTPADLIPGSWTVI